MSGLMRGLATLPPRWIHARSVVRDMDGRPQEDPLAVYCFCVCSGSALLGARSTWGKQIQGSICIFLNKKYLFFCIFSLGLYFMYSFVFL